MSFGGNWFKGDVCEIHDSPDECADSDFECGMDGTEDDLDEYDIVCGIHLFSGECTKDCLMVAN